MLNDIKATRQYEKRIKTTNSVLFAFSFYLLNYGKTTFIYMIFT